MDGIVREKRDHVSSRRVLARGPSITSAQEMRIESESERERLTRSPSFSFYNHQKRYFGIELFSSTWSLLYVALGSVCGTAVFLLFAWRARTRVHFASKEEPKESRQDQTVIERLQQQHKESNQTRLFNCIIISFEEDAEEYDIEARASRRGDLALALALAKNESRFLTILGAYSTSIQMLSIMTIPTLLVFLPVCESRVNEVQNLWYLKLTQFLLQT